ncbi:MAG: Plasmid maintenance system killer [Parcubacteria group bacterium GW2011_GWC2_38_7]|nr:MAG: Plasmid maintenance system killer [Parcubacteria group bacterium GW2011_GWC2_38_7]
MIISFKSKETAKVFSGVYTLKLPINIQRIALRKLYMLDAVVNINELMIPPANRLEKLRGKNKHSYSIRINNQWRLCFVWKDGNAHEVIITDYHS